jgi:formate hydrogenlyase subunit 6/NADH:ubiquinone oxidoreductase subunit I
MLKGEFHVKLPDAHQFGKMLVDLNNFLKPRLYVMDGIQAMEGNGPSGGRPKQMNVILISTDPIALDATVCRLINIDPEFVPTVKYGMESGAGTFRSEEIQLLGDDFERLQCPSFDIKRKAIRGYDPKRGGITRFVNNRLVPKPVIKAETCTFCGTCITMCPAQPKALDWFREHKDRPPVYNYERCIRCYCCQEVCPEGAIELKKPVLRRLFGGG